MILLSVSCSWTGNFHGNAGNSVLATNFPFQKISLLWRFRQQICPHFHQLWLFLHFCTVFRYHDFHSNLGLQKLGFCHFHNRTNVLFLNWINFNTMIRTGAAWHIWRLLKGVICVHKPPNVSIYKLQDLLIERVCQGNIT